MGSRATAQQRGARSQRGDMASNYVAMVSHPQAVVG